MTSPDASQLEELGAFALDLVRQAGDIITPMFDDLPAVRDKSAAGEAFDPVTTADIAAEERIRELIAARYPDHGIRGEELPDKPANGPFTWIIDPIDGTRAFVYGLPVWMTLAALLHDGRPLIGAARQPVTGETYLGTPEGAWLFAKGRKRRLHTRKGRALSQAMAGTTLPEIFVSPAQKRALSAMQNRTLQLRFDADAYFYALLAAGRIDIAFDTELNIFDIAAMIPIVRGAGGIITSWSGEENALEGDLLAAATPRLHAQALSAINDEEPPSG